MKRGLGRILQCLLATTPVVAAAQTTQTERLQGALTQFRQAQNERTQETIAHLREQLSSDFEPKQRLQAAIFLAAHYWEHDFRLARYYLGVAESLRLMDPEISLYDAEITHMRTRFRQKALADLATKQAIEDQLKASPEEPLRLSLVEMLLETNLALGLKKDFINVLQTYYPKYPRMVRKDRFIKEAAKIFREEKSGDAYYRTLEVLLDQYPVTDESRWALSQLLIHSKEPGNNGFDTYAFTYFLLKKVYRNSSDQPDLQSRILSVLSGKLRKTADRPPEMLDTDEHLRLYCYLQLYKPALALVAERMQNPKLSSSERESLSNWKAYITAEQGDHVSALEMYANSDKNIQFYESQAKSLMSAQRFSEAAAAYEQLIKRRDHPRYRWYHFWNLFASGNKSEAAKAFDKDSQALFAEGAFKNQALLYWQAKLHLRQGEIVEAQKILSPLLDEKATGYYRHLARQTMNQASVTLAQSAPNASRTSPASQTEKGEATRVGLSTLTSFPGVKPSAEGAAEKNSLKGLALPEEALPMTRSVSDITSMVEIDPYLILSIVRSESGFNSQALSSAGALGLMQLMPYTAQRLARLLGDRDFKLNQLQHSETNLLYGTMYLSLLLNYYQGHPIPAIAAYNAGPTAVNKWLRECRDCPVDAFVEFIPYAETRNYVKKVVSSYVSYGTADGLARPDFLSRELPRELPSEASIF